MPDKSRHRFELEEFHRNVSDDDLIADVKRVANALKKESITFREFNERGKFHSSTVALRFGSWIGALKKAGLKKSVSRNISDEELFRNLVDVWSKIGRQPKFRDLSSDVSTYSSSTYANRFGGWRNALNKFFGWANGTHVPLEPADRLDLKTRKTPRNVNWRLRALVLMRDGKCSLCGAGPKDGAKLHVDHIQPWSKGGETILGNLQILCERCNVGKSNQ